MQKTTTKTGILSKTLVVPKLLRPKERPFLLLQSRELLETGESAGHATVIKDTQLAWPALLVRAPFIAKAKITSVSSAREE